ncbi:MAG: hypothetical protein R2850_08405 [Bacteroidia bacterium]
MNNKEIKYQILLVVSLLLIYLISGFNVTITNDSLTNIEQVAAMDILHRSSHFGFHFLSVLFHAVFKLFGITDPVQSTQFMLSTFSVAGTLALFRIVLNWKNNLNLALVIAIIYGLNSNIWRFSVQCEYHVLVPSLSLIGISLWLNGKQFTGAIFGGLAVLTSPFAILSTPLIFIREIKFNRNIIIKSIAGFVLIIGSVSLFTYKETLQGEWSYNLVYQYYQKTLAITNFKRVFSIYLYGYARSFLILLPLVLYFVIKYRKSEKRLFLILLATLFIHIPVAIPENRYGAYQMTAYPILAIAAGFVLYNLYQNNKWKSTLIAGGFVLLNIFIVIQERSFHRGLRNMYLQMQNDSQIEENAYVFMYKATKPFNNKYASRLKGVSVYSEYQENLTENLENYNLPDYEEIIKSGLPVYLIESGVSLPDDYVKTALSGFVSKQGAKTKGVGMKKIKSICPGVRFEEVKGYSSRLFKVYCLL